MKIFPKISPKQYFVIFAEQATGIVINHVGMYSLEGDDQLWYSIFDNLEQAQNFIHLKLRQNPQLEGSIYDFNEQCIMMFYFDSKSADVRNYSDEPS